MQFHLTFLVWVIKFLRLNASLLDEIILFRAASA